MLQRKAIHVQHYIGRAATMLAIVLSQMHFASAFLCKRNSDCNYRDCVSFESYHCSESEAYPTLWLQFSHCL
jgi:hypothetical protein